MKGKKCRIVSDDFAAINAILIRGSVVSGMSVCGFPRWSWWQPALALDVSFSNCRLSARHHHLAPPCGLWEL